MDIHVNDLVFEEGFTYVPLKDVSFRDIDQEFIIVHSTESYDSKLTNDLFYCYIKPWEGLRFRLIGASNENDQTLVVDEDLADVQDYLYEELADETVSKIVENGDLLSNRLLVDLVYEFYEGREDLKNLLETRKVGWIDEKRVKGNPDAIKIAFDSFEQECRLVRCEGDDLIVRTWEGKLIRLNENGEWAETE
ncbi:MAG: hypothetical protein IJM50_07155 [Lachnospiraceae bacterium]|nr:hypothetical protein [Lachnospiraceae bacterium]